MNRSFPRFASAAAAVAVVSVGLVLPTAAHAAGSEDTNASETPISHLGLNLGADQTERNVNWLTASSAAEVVQVAPAPADGEPFPAASATTFPALTSASQDREGKQTAKATITGLQADSDYVYRVGSEESGWSESHRFSTRSFGDSFNFNFYGDAQLGSGESSSIGAGTGLEEDAQGWYDTLNASVGLYPDASFLFHAGDQIDGYGDDGFLEQILGDRDPQYDAFFAEGAEVLRQVPLATLSGNHDHEGFTYDEFFNMPNSDGRSYWYSYNNALVIGLDINTVSINDYIALAQLSSDEERAAYTASLRPQIEAGIARATDYAESVIAAEGADAEWIIVGFHQSPFSQANHYYDPDITIMREAFTQSLSDAGVDLVLGGHDHIYTRTHLMEGSTPVVPAEGSGIGDVLEQQDGQVLYLTGNSSSGSKFYDFMDTTRNDDPATVNLDDAHPSTALWEQSYRASFSNIAIDGNTLTVKTHHSADGALIDQVTLVHPGEEPVVPVEPEMPSEEETTPAEEKDPTDPEATDDPTPTGVSGENASSGNGEAKRLAQTGDDNGAAIALTVIAGALLTGGAALMLLRRLRTSD